MALSKEEKMDMLACMLTIRHFDEMGKVLVEEGQITGRYTNILAKRHRQSEFARPLRPMT